MTFDANADVEPTEDITRNLNEAPQFGLKVSSPQGCGRKGGQNVEAVRYFNKSCVVCQGQWVRMCGIVSVHSHVTPMETLQLSV